MKFLIANGKVTANDEINLNQIFTGYTFRLSKRVWYGHGGIPLLNENTELLLKQTEALQLPFPKELENRRELFRLTKRMLNKNRYYQSGYIHFQVIWQGNDIHTLITADPQTGFDFPWSETGLLATFSNQKKLRQNTFNSFPFLNEALWNAGRSEVRHTPFQQVIFLNEAGGICEGAHANIFLIKNNEIITPAPESGCYQDILRPLIFSAAKNLEMRLSEKEQIDKQLLFSADELFLASESQGIQWILGIETKRFLHACSKTIHETVNGMLKSKSMQ